MSVNLLLDNETDPVVWRGEQCQADSMWGEITPRMAQAVGQSDARRVLIPINLCSNLVVGVSEMSMSKLVQAAVDTVRRLTEKK